MSLRTGPMGGALDGLSAGAGLALPEKDRRTWEEVYPFMGLRKIPPDI